MRIKYNAPTVLSYTLVCVLVMILSQTLLPRLATNWFTVPGRTHFSPINLRNCDRHNRRVLILYLGDQFVKSFNSDNISYFAHIAGGFCGSLFGFVISPKHRRSPIPGPPPAPGPGR